MERAMLARAMAAVETVTTGPTAVLVGRAGMLGDARAALAAVGARVVAELDWAAVGPDTLFPAARALFVVEARGESDDLLAAALPRIDAAAAAADAPVVVSLAPAAIDVVAATLLGGRAQLLCEPDLAERTVALTLAARATGRPALSDTAAHEGEAVRLRRLNEEVARIAELLARLSRREAGEQRHADELADRRQIFAAQPAEEVAIDAGEVRRVIRARRLRDQFFGAGIFEEPAWDMILDLFAAELERARVSVSSLCIAAAVAPTTALRWIGKLTEAGLFERQPDPFDRRRAYLELSPRASRALRNHVAALRRAGLPLA